MYCISLLTNSSWGFNDTQTLEDHDLNQFYYKLKKSAPLNLMLHRNKEEQLNFIGFFDALVKEYYSGNRDKAVEGFRTYLECNNQTIEDNVYRILQLPFTEREAAMEDYIHLLELHRDVFHKMLLQNRL